MKLSSPSRFVAALFTLFCLLFTQLAVASHLCPEAAPVAALAHAAMPGCDMDMDMDQPGTCKAHCEMGHQSLDTAGTPPVPPFVAAGLAVVLVDVSAAAAQQALPDAALRARTTAPPIAIRNCCFRI